MVYNISFIVFLISFYLKGVICELRTCTPEDYHFEYTDCDNQGRRWRVSVPNHEVCTPTLSSFNRDSSVPVNGTNCNLECGRGEYLDLESQKCMNCKAGTYSSGSSTKYDDWTQLPVGFSVTTEPFISNSNSNCTESEWKPQGAYISTVPNQCSASLILSVKLKKPGYAVFEYQFDRPHSALMFYVAVQNSECQATMDPNAVVFPPETGSGKWNYGRAQLKSGFNVITWSVISTTASDQDTPGLVLIKTVSISGLAYSPVCVNCPPGSFSSDGVADCSFCPINTFSKKGSSGCTPCDAKTEYSEEGSSECVTRLPCTSDDYYHFYEPCNDDLKTRLMYQWIQPTICNSDLPESVKLPTDSDYIDCHQCNPGMHPVNGTCTFCPKEYRSNGSKCLKCEGSTAPDYGLSYLNWNTIPEGVIIKCTSMFNVKCGNDTKWLPRQDYLASYFARGESAMLTLSVEVPGFRTASQNSDGSSLTVGRVRVVFETNCSNYCRLELFANGHTIERWTGTVAKTIYTHDVKKNQSYTFILMFQNMDWTYGPKGRSNNTVKIYSIEVTNTIAGGAEQCQKCPKGSNQDGCIPCPDGHYINSSTVTCEKCPPGTVVYSHRLFGADSCRACGPGLQAYGGWACISDGYVSIDGNHTFDLSSLTGSHFIKGMPKFSSSGMQYYLGFNISLFGKPETAQISCSSNFTLSADNTTQETQNMDAMACRFYMVPAADGSEKTLTMHSNSLGDHLTAIKFNDTQDDTQEGSSIRMLYNISGFDSEDIEYDIQVYISAEAPTNSCPAGRTTVVSLRCDADQKDGGEIYLPPKCPDGTCDGCTFHFMWKVRDACPVCRKEDFKEVIGECVQGSQVIHYLPPQRCIIKEQMNQKTQSCSAITALPRTMLILVILLIGLGIIMLFVLCFFWRKSAKLQYRYMKLQQNYEDSNYGDLPGAESCGVDEEDVDETEDFVNLKKSGRAKFFKKFSKNKKEEDEDLSLFN